MMTSKLTCLAAMALCAASLAHAGRPLTVDDADPVDQGTVEVEAGLFFSRNHGDDHADIPIGFTYGYGLVDGLEAGIGFGWQLDRSTDEMGPHARETGMLDIPVGAKWRFLEESTWLPRQALAAGVNLPVADEDAELGTGATDCDLTWIASKSLGETVGLHLNAGYTWAGDPDGEDLSDVLHYGFALDIQLADRVQWVGEVFAETEVSGGSETMCQYSTGLRLDAGHGLTLDLAAGSGICGEAADLTATAGLTWAFGSR